MKQIEIVTKPLSDGSEVYAVEVGEGESVLSFECNDKESAEFFYHNMTDMLDSYTIEDYRIDF